MKFSIRDEGTIVLFTPLDDSASDWLAENCQTEDWQWLGNSLAVEHRYAQVLIDEISAERGELS